MAEWLKAHAWKACSPKGVRGSNPRLSAIQKRKPAHVRWLLHLKSWDQACLRTGASMQKRIRPEAGVAFSCGSSLPPEGTRAPEGASTSGSPPHFLCLQSHDGFPRGQQQLRRGIARQLRVLCAYVNRRDCRSHAIDNMICLPFRTHDGRSASAFHGDLKGLGK